VIKESLFWKMFKLRPGELEAISYERRDVVESSKKREQHGFET